MNLEQLIKLVLSNPKNIDIRYSNINGQEKLIVNGEEIKDEVDNNVMEEINTFKKNVQELPDYIFEQVIDKMEETYSDFKEMNDYLEKESYNKEEADVARDIMYQIGSTVTDVIEKELYILEKLNEKF